MLQLSRMDTTLYEDKDTEGFANLIKPVSGLSVTEDKEERRRPGGKEGCGESTCGSLCSEEEEEEKNTNLSPSFCLAAPCNTPNIWIEENRKKKKREKAAKNKEVRFVNVDKQTNRGDDGILRT